MLLILFSSLFSSFVLAILLVRYNNLHSKYSADSDTAGIQKFHANPVPRIGGIPIFLGLSIGLLVAGILNASIEFFYFMLACIPAFSFGLLEDLTKRIGPLPRLLATFVSAALGFYLLQGTINRIDIGWADHLLQSYTLLAFLFTIFAAGGVAHAFNIIDGYNGLSGTIAILTLLALAYVAFKVNDILLMSLCFAMIGAISGFLFLNFPHGLIFAGDGGAYLAGFTIAEISILLIARHPHVSAWFPLLVVIYPAFETVFTIYRRKFLQKRSIGHPDALHLHQIIYKRVVLWMVASKEAKHLTQRNSMTSPYLWVLSSSSVIPAMLFWDHTYVLMAFSVLFILSYIYLYKSIVRFRTPRWIMIDEQKKRNKKLNASFKSKPDSET
ncbi:MraY family glycosyltransferase [Chromobacterium sphagni]|uniref:Glycosyl transferase n=1 Tax=Chromobacterium sphagni TaxID=1903179 RepID=A0A1S1X253_9NEIS|nr:glycosyltransferase [Chromobacterium sphagni]OHX13592.1 glycosyl transferase [Chromobacterium sphagni]OHX22047.1 glycosyl transferase [Chromobacterium sphagni]